MSRLPDGDYSLQEFQSWATGRRPHRTPRGTLATLATSKFNYGEHGPEGHNGSVRAITDATGAVVAHYEFDAWGAQLGSSSPFSGGFSYGGFVGSLGVRTDATTGLLYMRHRWFDPNGLQRFLSRDIVPQPNRYVYALNDPITNLDPSGLDTSVLVTARPTGTLTSGSGTVVRTYQAIVYRDGAYVGSYNVTRSPYDAHTSRGRYSTYGEIPPGVYHASPGPFSQRIDIEDDYGSTVIQGPGGYRDGIQFHPQCNSDGCLTFPGTWPGDITEDPGSKDATYGEPFWRFKRDLWKDLQEPGGVRVYVLSRYNDDCGERQKNWKILHAFRHSRGVAPHQRRRRTLRNASDPSYPITQWLNRLKNTISK